MFNKKKPVARVTIDQFSSLISGNLSLVGDVTFEEGLKVLTRQSN
ncbi:polymer-forming cytoskeletal protein, partial [Stutzerimonas stutzeri]|nr:polymer-forming cytoskeletal protein [Stutzerimonas stutzeri]